VSALFDAKKNTARKKKSGKKRWTAGAIPFVPERTNGGETAQSAIPNNDRVAHLLSSSIARRAGPGRECGRVRSIILNAKRGVRETKSAPARFIR
jgi:hypothetical protein